MTTTLEQIELDRIIPHRSNPRRDVGDVVELAASIGEQGILEPLIVAPHPEQEGGFALLAGHRRLAAAQIAGLQEAPCIVRSDLSDPAAQIQVMLVENLQRTDLTPVEEAEAYQLLLTFEGWDEAKIAATTGRAETTVHARLKLTQLKPKVRARLQERQITLEQAVAIGEFADDEHGKAFVKDLEKAAGTPDWHRQLASAKQQRAGIKKGAAARAKLEKAGVKVLSESPGWGAKVNHLYHSKAAKQHAKCPGYAAFIDRWGDANYYCIGNECLVTKAASASSLGQPAGELVSAAEEKAKNAQRRDDKKKLTAAAEARHAHLAGLVAVGADADPVSDLVEHDDLFTAIARELTRPVIDSLMYRAADRAFVAQVLGIELPSQKGVDSYTFRNRFYGVIDELPLHRVLMIAAILSYGSVDYQLTTDAALWKAGHWRASRDPYLTFLHRTGYEPTPFEAPHINRALKQARPIVDVNLPDDDDKVASA